MLSMLLETESIQEDFQTTQEGTSGSVRLDVPFRSAGEIKLVRQAAPGEGADALQAFPQTIRPWRAAVDCKRGATHGRCSVPEGAQVSTN